MIADLLQRLLELPPLAVYGVIAGLAAAENIFPPVPADTAVALGAALSTGGPISAWGVFAVTWTANVTSAALVYAGARTVGRKFFRGPFGRRLVRREALARVEQLYDRYGAWAIFGSRFLPGVRAVVPAFSGVANLDTVRALVPLAVASAIWYGSLTFVAATIIRNVSLVADVITHVNRTAAIVLALLIGVAVFVWRMRRRRSP